MSKTDKKDYDQKGAKFLILLAKFKGHSTFRMVYFGRKKEGVKQIIQTHLSQVDEYRVGTMDGVTCEFTTPQIV